MTEPRCLTCNCKIGWTRYIRGFLRCEACALKAALARRSSRGRAA